MKGARGRRTGNSDAPHEAPALWSGVSSARRRLQPAQMRCSDEPPLPVKEGGMIRDGFSAELDELRNAQRGGKDWIAKLQADEIAATGIPSLKVRFNNVFGYYIEITRSNLKLAPADYERKQTLVNAERFTTPELKELEAKILDAEERSTTLEQELFAGIRKQVAGEARRIRQSARVLAELEPKQPDLTILAFSKSIPHCRVLE